MFQSGKTTFSKTAKAPAIHTPTNPALTKRQQELHKQVNFTYILEQVSLRPFVTDSDALPLSYRRLFRTEAIKAALSGF